MSKSFSQRYGYVEVKEIIQIESLDDNSRVAIWNVLYTSLWSNPQIISAYGYHCAKKIWTDFYRNPADNVPDLQMSISYSPSLLNRFKSNILTDEWYQVFDFIEFMFDALPIGAIKALRENLNSCFQKNGVAYTIIDTHVTPISNTEEIESIQSALNSGSESIRTHFRRALEMMVDRSQPDYRNSIKESISAIESLCKNITGDDKGTLGKCLVQIEKKHYIHPAMKLAFSQLFGYTSDQSGIRHSLKDGEQEPTLEDARFMLIACSAFSNYLLSIISE